MGLTGNNMGLIGNNEGLTGNNNKLSVISPSGDQMTPI